MCVCIFGICRAGNIAGDFDTLYTTLVVLLRTGRGSSLSAAPVLVTRARANVDALLYY